MPAAPRVIVKRANTAERVAVALRTAIARGELVAGAHVRQEEWAQRLSVSRAPREAMKMLVSEHLLTYDTHRGYFVNDVDPKQMADVYLVRTLLEAEVLKTIRWPTDEELATLRSSRTKRSTCCRMRVSTTPSMQRNRSSLRFTTFPIVSSSLAK